MAGLFSNIMNAFSSAGTGAGNPNTGPAAPSNQPANTQGVPNTPAGQQFTNTAAQDRNLDPAQNLPTPDPRPQNPDEDTKSPLESFSALFHTEPDDDKKKGAQNNPFDPNAPIFNLNEDEFKKQVSTMSFLPDSTKAELAEKLANGDPSAFMELVEAAVRAGYEKNAKFSALAAEQAAKVAMERSGRAVPGLLHGELTKQELRTQNKLFNDPALKPMAESIAQQYRTKYPDASASDIARYTNHYFESVAKAFTGKADSGTSGNQEGNQQDEIFDFGNFFGSSASS